ncbi:MAG: hypothetical protein IJ347_07055 [Faecalibacterium sp.]|nr:hypothetical protein [Faecalibacterium sp.]
MKKFSTKMTAEELWAYYDSLKAKKKKRDKLLHHRALGIFVHNTSCDQCFWGPRSKNDPFCYIPYSDGTIEVYKLNPCYMGVYRHLSGGEVSPMEQRYLKERDRRNKAFLSANNQPLPFLVPISAFLPNSDDTERSCPCEPL